MAAFALSTVTMPTALGAQMATPPTPKRFELVDPTTVSPVTLLPPPPARGSREEAAELAELHALIAAAPPTRLAQARADDGVEDPSIFDAATGRSLERQCLLPGRSCAPCRTMPIAPSIWPRIIFGRPRPWGIDPTLHNCDAAPGRKPTRSYPSGHAVLGYSVAYVLARLAPDRAPQVMARAADYALSREYCAAHFPSDTEASHVVGTLIAAQLLADPRLAGRIAAARAELAAR